ncbi:hypothetical protein GJ496_002910 [Pomphorhynchus laevis]|nr:hypothetical protein GJ496_002910 [Pomphorhynchus laevis]
MDPYCQNDIATIDKDFMAGLLKYLSYVQRRCRSVVIFETSENKMSYSRRKVPTTTVINKVMNLSFSELSTDQQEVLSLGLSFATMPRELERLKLIDIIRYMPKAMFTDENRVITTTERQARLHAPEIQKYVTISPNIRREKQDATIVNFLDVKLSKTSTKSWETYMYRKFGDTRNLNEAIRAKNICSNNVIFKRCLLDIHKEFVDRGYTHKLIRRQFDDARRIQSAKNKAITRTQLQGFRHQK